MTDVPKAPPKHLYFQVKSLVLLCYWANLLDAVFTASHLTNGAVEWNVIMRFLWTVSPVAYATGKFVFFRVGMEFLERSFPDLKHKRNVLLATVLAFTGVNLWHLLSGTTCVASLFCLP